MYSESPGPSGCNVGYAAPSYVASRGFVNFGTVDFSWIILRHETREAVLFLFATLLCEFVLLFCALLLSLFHWGWFVQFDFSVKKAITNVWMM